MDIKQSIISLQKYLKPRKNGRWYYDSDQWGRYKLHWKKDF